MGEAEQQHKKSLEHYRNALDLYKVEQITLLTFDSAAFL
jgi:hypothetical protein